MKYLIILFTLFSTTSLFGQTKQGKKLSDFIPKGYVLFDTLKGDLNKDGLDDQVIIIKATSEAGVVHDEVRGKLDRNRRGIIILFRQNDGYVLATKNYKCFSSENEDGGVYFAPELTVSIEKGNLYIHYGHGRYGHWKYTFKYRGSDFELIGYDASSDRGPIVESETSINFLTKKKRVKRNTNEDPDQESGQEVFKETWTKIKLDKLIRLSQIKDFDELDMSYE